MLIDAAEWFRALDPDVDASRPMAELQSLTVRETQVSYAVSVRNRCSRPFGANVLPVLDLAEGGHCPEGCYNHKFAASVRSFDRCFDAKREYWEPA
jgi:hypothetical protein